MNINKLQLLDERSKADPLHAAHFFTKELLEENQKLKEALFFVKDRFVCPEEHQDKTFAQVTKEILEKIEGALV